MGVEPLAGLCPDAAKERGEAIAFQIFGAAPMAMCEPDLRVGCVLEDLQVEAAFEVAYLLAMLLEVLAEEGDAIGAEAHFDEANEHT